MYVITDVALTPLSSKSEAHAAISHTQANLRKRTVEGHPLEDCDESEDDDEPTSQVSEEADEDEHDLDIRRQLASKAVPTGSDHKRSTSVAEDVMARKGGYGRFAQKWFSKAGWTVDQRRNLGLSAAGASTPYDPPADAHARNANEDFNAVNSTVAGQGGEEASADVVRKEEVKSVPANLLPKLLRTTEVLFGSSRSFYFSYDYDITRSFANRKINTSELPLHQEVDPLFFWNKHLISPFIESNQHCFVLPLLQGFVGQQAFTAGGLKPEVDAAVSSSMEMKDMSESGIASSLHESQARNFLLTLISRRSIKRAGLRYLRRGVDEEGNTANCVETEQILSDSEWNASSKAYSFMQLRGSIPVFFSQSPYSFKPVPQVQRSADANYTAFYNHFYSIISRYGNVQVVSLVEKHGNEAKVGDEYQKYMKQLNDSGGIKSKVVGFEWFDFHSVCRGMKFENVALLMDLLGSTLDSFGTSIEIDGKVQQKQSGILRTNCMDCLDRTNVVQSACARRALEQQLHEEGIEMSTQADHSTSWFNELWASNGDAISNQYASTAALKGDFTRTGKRNYKGAITDMGLSISRFYSG